MARPVMEQSLSGQAATGDGSQLETGGRVTVSLFASTDVDPTTLDMRLEVSMDGQNWTALRKGGSAVGLLTAAEFEDPEGDGNFAAYVTVHGVAARYIRAAITAYDAAGNADAYVAATSNPNTAYDYRLTNG